MAKDIRVQIDKVGSTILKELTVYRDSVVSAVDAESEKAVRRLAKLTRSTAPVRTGRYRAKITSGLLKKKRFGSTYAWYVKSPEHRLTHLLVHGHEMRDGGRTPGNSFLHDAVDAVMPEYEKAVEEAIRNG